MANTSPLQAPEALERSEGSVRASISFPPNVYRTLEEIARKKKVSVAWVVREAAEQYVDGQTPLFGSQR
jgi:metal-responsive CopG/Arc/MetJ family transcriptional regulator